MPETTDGRPTPRLHIVSHPLVQHKLTQMRRVETPSERFRQLLTETSLLLTYEVTRELPLGTVQIQTPLTTTEAPELMEEPVVVSILRAGNGLLDGVLRVLPSARVGFVGLYRDHETLEAIEYYCKFPPLSGRTVIVLDPMLATGNSASAALERVKADDPAGRRPVPVPARRTRGDRSPAGRPPRRGHMDRCRGRTSQRDRLHRAGTGRCR